MTDLRESNDVFKLRTPRLSHGVTNNVALPDMISIMVNKLVYYCDKHSVKDIMDKYYEMFRGKNSANKQNFFNSPDSPDHSDQDSDTNG